MHEIEPCMKKCSLPRHCKKFFSFTQELKLFIDILDILQQIVQFFSASCISSFSKVYTLYSLQVWLYSWT